MVFAGDYAYAALWFALTSLMVAGVALYPRVAAPDGVNAANAAMYLRGHTLISSATGALWAGLAVGYLDQTSLLHMFITINMVSSITLGGMLPSAEYRPAFIALSTTMVLPFACYWLVAVDGPLRVIGIGLLIFYGFGVLVSGRAEIQTRDSLAAQRHRKLSERLQAKTEELERANFAKSRLLAATSHDMAQPLQAQGFMMTALRAYLDRPEQRELLDRIEAAWRTQKELLDAVVDGARVEGGAVQVRRRPTAIDPLLNEARSLFEAEAARRGVILTVSGAALSADTDPAILSRILRNLTANAVKFTRPGGRVELVSRRENDRVVVEVIDTGPGVSEADKARIFEAFVRLDPAAGDGLGLGLSIVEHLAGALEAPLYFESTPGVGTRAGVLLEPAAALVPAPPSRPVPAPRVQSPRTATIGGAPLILVIEDDEAVRDGLSRLLTDWGCRVVAAESGPRALTMLTLIGENPAFAVVDKRLAANEDGVEALESVRRAAGAPIPAVLLTGDISGFDTVRDAPGLCVLTKPADPGALRALIMEATAAAV
jgi:signal transduction histidine kinase/CheY-like chemotaxis protein